MAKPMTIYRLEDLSMNYFVRGIFQDYPQITIVDDFPEEILQLPTIAVVAGRLIEEEFELGNRDKGIRTRRWFIDVYGKTKSQRDDFAYDILDATDDGLSVYDYNEGFPPEASPATLNHLSVISQSYEPLKVVRTSNEKLYYRGQLILITQNDLV